VLTIIPARGGSKGVSRKNVRTVGGKPLIAWTILAAKASRLGRTCYVSTEDDEISTVAQRWGTDVISRPHYLADDSTPMIDVIRHALDVCEARAGSAFDYIMLLQPTAPMRKSEDIDAAADILQQSAADSVISVYRVEDAHPARMYRIIDGLLEPFSNEHTVSLRQDLPVLFHRNGAIYICKRRLITEESRLWGGRIYPYIMPKSRSVNIDDEQDLMLADYLLSYHNEAQD